jgi:NAD(P)-dependent dehydrogenase (short-subunit alcohol dehydrogenase family)
MTQLLNDKNAIIYGAGGTLGREVARTFAREGANLFLAGRTRSTLDETAKAVEEEGRTAHVTVLDALDGSAVRAHVDDVATQAGRIDVSFNLITRGDVQAIPLLDMSVDDFMAPTQLGVRSQFITACAAGRHMIAQKSGVILFLTSGSGAVTKPNPGYSMGGTGPADAATESLLHYLAAEVGQYGVRVNGIWTAGVNYPDVMAGLSILKLGPTKAQAADAAAFLASDRAGGTTNTILDASSGVCAP